MAAFAKYRIHEIIYFMSCALVCILFSYKLYHFSDLYYNNQATCTSCFMFTLDRDDYISLSCMLPVLSLICVVKILIGLTCSSYFIL